MNNVEFKPIPDYPYILINRSGIVLDTRTNRIVKPFRRTNVRKNNYVVVRFQVEGKYKIFLLHRLLAMTFLDKPEHLKDSPFSELQVNHIDAVKNNNRLENLEWCTAKENIRHTHRLGLHSRSYKVDAKDVKTDEVLEFNNAEDCAKYYGIKSLSLFRMIQVAKPFKIQDDFVIFKFHNEPWPNQDSDQVIEIKSGFPIPVVAINIETNEKYIFNGFMSASRALGIKNDAISRYLVKGKPFGKWKFEFLKSKEQIPEHEIEARKQRLRSWKRKVQLPVPITVVNINTGESKRWISCEEFARNIGVKKNTLQSIMSKNNGRYKNWNIVYEYNRYGRSARNN